MFGKKPKAPLPYVVLRWRGRYEVEVVGESFHTDNILAVLAESSEAAQRQQEIFTFGELVNEPTNPHDPNAVMVFVKGKHVGYLNKKDANFVEAWVRQVNGTGYRFGVRVVVGWAGNRNTAPIGVRLDIPQPSRANVNMNFDE